MDLQDVCISVIAQEFETFYYAASVLNDEALKDNLKILQKKYSYELGSELFKRKKLKNEYLDFFISEHLQILDLGWLENCVFLTSLKDIFCRLPFLTKVIGCQCNDEILENIAKYCPKIVEIDAVFSDVTDAGIKYLCKKENGEVPCPELKKVLVHHSKVTDEGVKYLLQNLSSLEDIDYRNIPQILYALHENDLPRLENVPCYNLVSLNLFSRLPYYSDLLKICLTVCPRLKTIYCFITDKEQLNFLKKFSLKKLKIQFLFPDSQFNIDNFLKFSGNNLLSLGICNCTVSIRDLVVSCPKLMYLCIENVIVSDNDDCSQLILHHLNELVFSHIEDYTIIDKAVRFLVLSSPKLEVLSFLSCTLSRDTKACILKCSENHLLKKIRFYCARIEMDFVKDILSSSPSLEVIEIFDCGFLSEEKEELNQMDPNGKNEDQKRLDRNNESRRLKRQMETTEEQIVRLRKRMETGDQELDFEIFLAF